MVKVRLAIRYIYDRPWPAQRPVHNRASRLQPFAPDGSQHTLKCSPAALDPRYSCWQCCCGAPCHTAVLRVSVLCLPCAYLQAHRTRVQPFTTTQTQLPPAVPAPCLSLPGDRDAARGVPAGCSAPDRLWPSRAGAAARFFYRACAQRSCRCHQLCAPSGCRVHGGYRQVSGGGRPD